MIARDTYALTDLIARERTVTVCLPARNEAAAIGHTVETLVGLRTLGAVDQVLVLGGDSHDETDRIARDAGAMVCDTSKVFTELGPILGKGDAMWRGLSAITTDVVVFIDADLDTNLERLVCGLAGPLVTARSQPDPVRFVKGAFRRHHPDYITDQDPYDGGRVTESVARPLINLMRPDLAAFYQPLGGQVAADTELIRAIPIMTGYAVEIVMLLDVVDRVGLGCVAEADLGDLENRPRTTSELAPMAQEVIFGFLHRVRPASVSSGWQPYRRPRFDGGWDVASATIVQRPPMGEFTQG